MQFKNYPIPSMNEAMAKVNPKIFHDHLDECTQCKENPFGLCDEGVKKLYEATGIGMPNRQSDTETISGRRVTTPEFHFYPPLHDEIYHVNSPNLNGDSFPSIDYAVLELKMLAKTWEHQDTPSTWSETLHRMLKQILPPEET